MQTQQTQNSFPGPKSYRAFRETGPWSNQSFNKKNQLIDVLVCVIRTRIHLLFLFSSSPNKLEMNFIRSLRVVITPSVVERRKRLEACNRMNFRLEMRDCPQNVTFAGEANVSANLSAAGIIFRYTSPRTGFIFLIALCLCNNMTPS